MAKEVKKDGRGRPQAERPKGVQISFRVDASVAADLERKRKETGMSTLSLSEMARQVVVWFFEREGRR